LVCSGQLDLKTAQEPIASNWIEAYQKYVSPNPLISRLASPAAAEVPLNSDQVWSQHKEREVLEAGIALLWQNQTWRIHVRKRSSPEGVPSGERYRRDYGRES